MGDEFRAADQVEWRTMRGTTRGNVGRELTAPIAIVGHHAAASAENPEYLVGDESGEEVAHKPGALRKRRDSTGG